MPPRERVRRELSERAIIAERLPTKGTSTNQGVDTVAACTNHDCDSNSQFNAILSMKTKKNANWGTGLAAGKQVCKGEIYCNDF